MQNGRSWCFSRFVVPWSTRLNEVAERPLGVGVLKGHGFPAVPLTLLKRCTARLKPRPFKTACVLSKLCLGEFSVVLEIKCNINIK